MTSERAAEMGRRSGEARRARLASMGVDENVLLQGPKTAEDVRDIVSRQIALMLNNPKQAKQAGVGRILFACNIFLKALQLAGQKARRSWVPGKGFVDLA
jgi:hypothetical protein